MGKKEVKCVKKKEKMRKKERENAQKTMKKCAQKSAKMRTYPSGHQCSQRPRDCITTFVIIKRKVLDELVHKRTLDGEEQYTKDSDDEGVSVRLARVELFLIQG